MNIVVVRAFGLIAALQMCACGEPESLEPSPTRESKTILGGCEPSVPLFPLVGGDLYVGAIIPETYFGKLGNDEARFARSLGFAAQGSWTPGSDDVQGAEARLLEVLTEA